jgi:hypothetical protein
MKIAPTTFFYLFRKCCNLNSTSKRFLIASIFYKLIQIENGTWFSRKKPFNHVIALIYLVVNLKVKRVILTQFVIPLCYL